MTKDLSFYRGLPYQRRVKPVSEDGDVYFLAWYEELPAVKSHGGSPEEAIAEVLKAFDDFIAACLHWGDPIPEPIRWSPGMYPRQMDLGVTMDVVTVEPRLSSAAPFTHRTSQEHAMVGAVSSEFETWAFGVDQERPPSQG